MATLAKFDSQINRFVIPSYLSMEQRHDFERLAAEIEEKHLEDPKFLNGERYLEAELTVDEVVIKALKDLCEMVGFSAFYGRDLSHWLFGLVLAK